MDVVTFEPNQILCFEKPESDENGASSPPAQCHLLITNNSKTDAILFRIQTTSPLSYRVRPSHGRVGPGEVLDVNVLLVSESKKQDKFLIKYAPIANDITGEFLELFASVDGASKEHRLKCVIGDGRTAGGLAESTSSLNMPPAPTETTSKPAAQATPPRGLGMLLKEEGEKGGSNVSIDSLSTNLASNDPEALKKDLRESRSTIQKLLAQNQDLLSQLDQLKKQQQRATPAAASAGIAAPPPEWVAMLNSQTGFPPVLVILIALFSFLVGLLF